MATGRGVPTAAIQYAHDIGVQRTQHANTIARWSDVENGSGHFAAVE